MKKNQLLEGCAHSWSLSASLGHDIVRQIVTHSLILVFKIELIENDESI